MEKDNIEPIEKIELVVIESQLEMTEEDENSLIVVEQLSDNIDDIPKDINENSDLTEQNKKISKVGEDYSGRTSKDNDELIDLDKDEKTDLLEEENILQEDEIDKEKAINEIIVLQEEEENNIKGDEEINILQEGEENNINGDEEINILQEGEENNINGDEEINILKENEADENNEVEEIGGLEKNISEEEKEEINSLKEEKISDEKELSDVDNINNLNSTDKLNLKAEITETENNEDIISPKEIGKEENVESIKEDEAEIPVEDLSNRKEDEQEQVENDEINKIVDNKSETISKSNDNDEENNKENYLSNEFEEKIEDNVLPQNEMKENSNKSNQIDEEIDDKIESGENDYHEQEDNNNSDHESKMNEIANERKDKNSSVTNFFTVPIQLDDGSVKNQLVTIVKSKSKKLYLGGYRHKISQKEYHHAAVQTMPRVRPPPKTLLFSRDSQTFQLKHQKINTKITTSTQMTKPGVYVSNVTDKLIKSKHYETADEYQKRILDNIIMIQKYYRRWLAKRVVDEKRKQRDDRLNWENNDKNRKQREKEERIKNEYERRMHPKSKADFDLLYNDLEKWREEQLMNIENGDFTNAEKKAKRVLLLEEETDLLAAIDRHKIDRKEETKTEAIQKILGKAAAPKNWKDAKGRKIEMDTQFTIRSRELLEIFNSLNMQYLTPDERLDVLLTLKHTVKEHDCKLTKEIVELIDREADLIMRNIKDVSLAGLRKRISTLFLQYCKTPTFNPQISLLLKVPPDPSVLIGDINYCKYCGRYLRSTEFSLSTKSSKLTICKSCARKDNQSRNRQDYSHYRRILKEIQMNEQQIEDGSKIAFIFKQNDIKSLIESVWDGKSIMSGCEDLDELVFLRWNIKEHWSPWNTVFLTKDEAEAHIKVSDLSETYSNVLINRILQKHVIAKNLFGSLEKMISEFQSKTSKVPIKI